MHLSTKLDFWLSKNYNVLLRGRQGCGKSTLVIDAFNRAGLKWKYFSAATMDPWVDFIGIPKEVKHENGNSYLELIRPQVFQDDEVEAIFFDEFNRANSRKILNAVMELIQFKSINGKKFNNLRIIWAAINPENDEIQKFHVEELDPAQLDRFHVIVDVPYLPDLEYFEKKYGQEMAKAAIIWWKELDSKIQLEISPRRLDYALQVYQDGGDIRDVLTNKANINKLLLEINDGSISGKLDDLFKNQNISEAQAFLAIENNFSACLQYILKNNNYINFFVPLMAEEKISSLIIQNIKIEKFALNNYEKFTELLQNIAQANANPKLTKKINEKFSKNNVINTTLPTKHFSEHTESQYEPILNIILAERGSLRWQSSQNRKSWYNSLSKYMPQIMSINSAQNSLKILNSIIERSQINTINTQFINLIPMFNHVISILKENKESINISLYIKNKLKYFPNCISI